jgi:hypothetical protein
LATTVQNIVTRHTSTGARKVQKDTEAIGKAQTRLGQASASAGRQFSAQATGLGGIVSAYAGAAANIFALTAAFFALQRAAEFEQIIAGTNALASSIGESGTAILNNIQKITKGQLSLVEAAQTANLALASGFSGDQIDRLTSVSLRASKALGRNLNDAFTRVVRGAAKLEPELLDELGIFTRIDPAVRKYADSVGKSVSSLTNFERRQAFVNEVIAEGEQKFRDVDTSAQTAAVSLERLAAKLIETGAAFGGVVADSLAPFADFISGNLSNVFALFGVLARVVGAQAISVFGGAINKASKSIEAFGVRGAEAVNFLSRGFAQATRAAAENAEAGIRFSRFGKAQEVQRRQLAQATLAEVAAGQALTRAKYEEVRATLVAAAADQRAIASRIKNTAEKKIAREAARGLITQIRLLDAAQKAAIPGTNAFAVALRGVAGAAAFLGNTLNRALGIITTVISVLSILQLAIDGVFKVFGFENFNLLEKLVELFQTFIKFLRGTIEQTRALVSANREFIISSNLAGISQQRQNNIIGVATEKVTEYIDAVTKNKLGTSNILNVFPLRKDAALIEATIKTLLGLFEELSGVTGKAGRLAGSQILTALEIVSTQTGVGLKKIIQFVNETKELKDNLGLAGNAAGELEIKIGNISQILTKVSEKGVVSFVKGFEVAGPLLSALIIKQKEFADDLFRGLLNAEKAAASVGAQEAIINNLLKERDRLEANLQDIGPLNALIAEAQIQKILLAGDRDRLIELEKTGKLLDKVFGKPGEKLERRVFTGEISEGGTVATSSREKELNVVKALTNELQKLKDVQEAIKGDTKGVLRDRELLQRALKIENAALQDLKKKEAEGEDNLEKQRSISSAILEIKGLIAETEEKIKKSRSDFIQLEKNALVATQQLVFERDKLASKIDKEIFSLQSKILSLQLKSVQLQEKNNMLVSKDQLEAQKAVTQELINQNKARESFLKDIGGLTRDDKLGIASQTRDLQIALADADKDFARKKAESDKKVNDQRLKLDILKLEQDRKLTTIQIQTTIELIKELNKNSLAIENASRKARGEAPIESDGSGLRIRISGTENLLAKMNQDFNNATNNIISNTVIANNLQEGLAKNSADRKYEIAKTAAEREYNLLVERERLNVRLFKGVNKALSDNLSSGLNEMFDAIAQGEFTLKSFREGFNQFLFNLLNDIRKQFLRETLIDPLKEGATDLLKGVFNIGSSTAKVGVGSSIPTGINLTAGGGAPNFDALFASGGPVRKLAAGGMQRDRVPALLEPGEFVMKRSAARSIGESNLNAMNATGSPGNVAVNIINQGTPQESNQPSAPRFDGEKFVIDIVTRDLRNNGPIRKSLRGAT